MKELFCSIKILVLLGVLAYAGATACIIGNDEEAFNAYRTEVCLKNLTLQDAYDAIKNGETNKHTKINYGVKPYITYLYETKIKESK